MVTVDGVRTGREPGGGRTGDQRRRPGARRDALARRPAPGPRRPGVRRRVGGRRRRQRLHRRERGGRPRVGRAVTTASAGSTPPASARTGRGPQHRRARRPAATCSPSATPTTSSGRDGSPALASALEARRRGGRRLRLLVAQRSAGRRRLGRPRPDSSASSPPASGPTSRCGASAFEEVGGFAEELPIGEDIDLCWRLQLRGFRFAVASDAVVAKRDHPGPAGSSATGSPTGGAGRSSTGATGRTAPDPIWSGRPGRGSGWSSTLPCSAARAGSRTSGLHAAGVRIGRLARLGQRSGCSSPDAARPGFLPAPPLRAGQSTFQSAPT